MSLTRANIEAVLIKRCGHLLTVAGLDGTTVAGTNADLGDPIAFALRQIGVGVTTPTSPTDAEVASASTDDTDQLLDLAEIRTLETILQHLLDLVDTEAGARVDAYSQLAAGIQARLERAQAQAKALYGWTAGTLESGYAYLDFAQHGDDDDA